MDLKKGGVALLIMVSLGVLSFVIYSLFLSWEFAILLIGSLVFHEYGHLWAAKRVGMQTKGIYLIPFVGGVAVSGGRPPSQAAWVFVALAGPAFGFALALVTALAYVLTGWTVLAAAAWWMAMLNLFNLIPIYPLDGGQVMHCIACSVPRPVGIVICGISLLLAVGVVLIGPLLLGMLIVWMAWSGLADYMWGRPHREWQRRTLEVAEEDLEDGSLKDDDRLRLSLICAERNSEDPFPKILSARELLPRVRAKIEELTEPRSLTGAGVMLSVESYLLLAGVLALLFVHTITVPGALESFYQIVGIPVQ